MKLIARAFRIFYLNSSQSAGPRIQSRNLHNVNQDHYHITNFLDDMEIVF